MSFRRIGRWLVLLLGFGLLGPPVSAADSTDPGRRLRILTTLPPLYSWTAQVAGDLAQVENLLPGDVGPHEFQFRPRDLEKLRQADLIIANGLGIENWMEDAIRNNAKESARRVVRTSDGLQPHLIYHLPDFAVEGAESKSSKGHDHDHDHDHDHAGETGNPHVWLDPVFARHGVTNILRALQQADPARAAGYARNAEQYLETLRRLDADFAQLSREVKNRRLVTYHDAFPYFTRRYQLELVGVVQDVAGVEPSPKYLAALSRAIRREKVAAIFTEPQFNPRLVRRLSEDLKIPVAELDVLETGKPTPEFYESGMRRNLAALRNTLR